MSPWRRHRRDDRGLWSQEPSIDGDVEPIGDLPGAVLHEAVFVADPATEELRPWKTVLAFLIGINAALCVVGTGVVWMLWRST